VSVPDVGILDTNAVILAGRLDPDHLSAEAVITAITLAELSLGPLATDDPRERALRQLRLQDAEANFDPLPFDAPAARAYGRVADALRRSGRKPAARAFDALNRGDRAGKRSAVVRLQPRRLHRDRGAGRRPGPSSRSALS